MNGFERQFASHGKRLYSRLREHGKRPHPLRGRLSQCDARDGAQRRNLIPLLLSPNRFGRCAASNAVRPARSGVASHKCDCCNARRMALRQEWIEQERVAGQLPTAQHTLLNSAGRPRSVAARSDGRVNSDAVFLPPWMWQRGHLFCQIARSKNLLRLPLGFSCANIC